MEAEKRGNTDIAYLPIDLLFNAIYFSGELGGGVLNCLTLLFNFPANETNPSVQTMWRKEQK